MWLGDSRSERLTIPKKGANLGASSDSMMGGMDNYGVASVGGAVVGRISLRGFEACQRMNGGRGCVTLHVMQVPPPVGKLSLMRVYNVQPITQIEKYQGTYLDCWDKREKRRMFVYTITYGMHVARELVRLKSF